MGLESQGRERAIERGTGAAADTGVQTGTERTDYQRPPEDDIALRWFGQGGRNSIAPPAPKTVPDIAQPSKPEPSRKPYEVPRLGQGETGYNPGSRFIPRSWLTPIAPPDLDLPTLVIGENTENLPGPRFERVPGNSNDARLYQQIRDSVGLVRVTKTSEKGDIPAAGTAFFVNDTGLMATAYHVIDGIKPDSLTVEMSDGTVRTGRVVRARPTVDAAIVQLDLKPGDRFTPIPLGNSSGTKKGDYVATVGHPHAWRPAVISPGELNRRQTIADGPGPNSRENPNAIILDSDINVQGGNSGGPLVNSKGEAIGIVNYRIGSVKGQFIPIEEIKPLITGARNSNDMRSYFFPDALHVEEHTKKMGYAAGAATTNVGIFALTARTNVPTLRRFGQVPLGAVVATMGFEEFETDSNFLSTAIQHGSAAEKTSAIANVTADVFMMGGPALTLLKKVRGIGTAITLTGAAMKFGNDLFADRKMY